MGLIKNLLNSRAVDRVVQNAVQQTDGFNNTFLYQRNINPHELFFSGINKNGRYDNFYGDANKLVTGAAKYLPYYVVDNEVADAEQEGTFAYYLKRPNDDYPLRTFIEKIYTELITHGQSEIFIWRTDGDGETTHFEGRVSEENYRGITLVSGYDRNKLTKRDLDDIVAITYGASQANVFLGYSPTQAAQSWRKMQDEMGLHMTAFAKNAGMPLGTFVITASSPEEFSKLRDKLDGKINGAKNAGKVLYSYRPSEAGQAQIEWVQYTSKDVQDYTPSLEFAEKKMTQNFGVPGTIKGTNDSENYATANVSKRNFAEWTLEPLVGALVEQLQFHLAKRFDLRGEVRADVEIPELADESLVKIQATTQEVALFDQKRAEGYTAESIVTAYNLPQRFLLLERESDTSNASNKPQNASKKEKHNHAHVKTRDEYFRHYQNVLTPEQREQLEQGFTDILRGYADEIRAGGLTDELRLEFENSMVDYFGFEYPNLYDISLEDVASALADLLDTVDIASLELSDDELEYARTQYRERVDAFSTSFAEQIEKIEGETLEVRSRREDAHIKMVAVTESEHTRIVSELRSWTRAQEEFPVRVYKTWTALPDACPECVALNDIRIDVTGLFVANPTDEIYEVQGGGAHPNCRCFVRYEVVSE